MRIERDLRRLQRSAHGRLRRLRYVAVLCSTGRATPKDRELGVTYCALELYNLWYSFSRCFFLSAAFGAGDGAGVRVAIGTGARPRSVEEALTYAIRIRPGYRNRVPPWKWQDEPSWVKPTVLLDALRAIGASNTTRVSAGLSASSGVFDDLPPFRHFFAHRGRDTAQPLKRRIRAQSISPAVRPTEALLTPASVLGAVRPQPWLLDWIDDLTNAVPLVVWVFRGAR